MIPCRSARRRRAGRRRRGTWPRRGPARRCVPLTRPGTATSPCSSCRLASVRQSAVRASPTGPPNTPECAGRSSIATSTVTSTSPRRLVVRRGHVDGRVGRVGDHDDVAGQRVAVLLQERGEGGRAGLLLALDEQRDADRRAAVEGAQHGEVGHDAGLVVGGAAGVEAAVPLGGLERGAGPQLVAAGRLDVVVGVEQHGRRAGRGGPVGDAPPGAPPSAATIRDVGRPASRARSATASALRRVSSACAGSAQMLGMRTRRSRSARAPGSARRRRRQVGGQVVAAVLPQVRHGADATRPDRQDRGVHERRSHVPDAGLGYRNAEVMCPDAGLALTWREFCVPVHQLRVRARARAQRGTLAVGSRSCPGSWRRCWHRRPVTTRHDHRGTAQPRPTHVARGPRHALRRGRARAGGGAASGGARPSACWPASRRRSPRPRRPSGSAAAA